MKKHNKTLFLLTLATAVTVPVVVGSQHSNASNEVITNYEPTVAVATSKTFKDITSKYVYRDIIYKMTAQNIINGYEDGTFRPNETLSRKHAAALVNRAVKLPKTTTFKAPKDLSTKNSYYLDIKALMEAGLLNVDSKGYINPNAPLTRGEMAKILAVAFDLEGTKHPLTDVSKEINEYVSALYENGVTTGYEDKTFREKQPLTRSHFALFMYRAMNVEPLKDLEELTDEEILAMSDEELARYILPYKYELEEKYIPKGIKDVEKLLEKNRNEFNKLSVQLGTNMVMNKHMVKGFERSLQGLVKGWSQNTFGTSPKEVINLINEVYSEGIVVSSLTVESKKPVVMYYDYINGNMVISRKD